MSTFVSLFAGVGGFDLGLERSGHTCVGQVEIDKHAQKILKKHWPDVPLHDDVTTAIEWAKEIDLIGKVDIVCGGFPCQDVSVAGKRAGIAGASNLGVGNFELYDFPAGDVAPTLTALRSRDTLTYLGSGKSIANCIPAELYHHGTVVNQDANNGHVVVHQKS